MDPTAIAKQPPFNLDNLPWIDDSSGSEIEQDELPSVAQANENAKKREEDTRLDAFKVTNADNNTAPSVQAPAAESDETLPASHADKSKPEAKISSSALAAVEQPSTSGADTIKFTITIKEGQVTSFTEPDTDNFTSVIKIGSQKMDRDVAKGRYELSLEPASASPTDALSPDQKRELLGRLLCVNVHRRMFYTDLPAIQLKDTPSLPIVEEQLPDGTCKFYVDVSFLTAYYTVMALLPETTLPEDVGSEIPEKDQAEIKSKPENKIQTAISLTMTRIADLRSSSRPKTSPPDETIQPQETSPDKNDIEETSEGSVSSCGLTNCFGFNFQTLRSRHTTKTA